MKNKSTIIVLAILTVFIGLIAWAMYMGIGMDNQSKEDYNRGYQDALSRQPILYLGDEEIDQLIDNPLVSPKPDTITWSSSYRVFTKTHGWVAVYYTISENITEVYVIYPVKLSFNEDGGLKAK